MCFVNNIMKEECQLAGSGAANGRSDYEFLTQIHSLRKSAEIC